MKTPVVLLTGAADVSHTPLSHSQHSSARKNEYIKALHYYVQSYPKIQFVYADSSGYDPRVDSSILDEYPNIIFHTSACQNVVRQFGKGAGEQLSIRKAISELDVLKQANLILKINGRYKTTNLNFLYQDIIDNYPTFTLYGTFRRNLKWFDSRCFAAPPQLYFDLAKYPINDFDNIYFEHVLSLVMLKYASIEGNSWKMFNKRPRFNGKSGNTGIKYNAIILEALGKDILYTVRQKITEI